MRNEVVAVQKEETCTERRPSLIKTEKPMPCYVESTLAPTAFSYAQKSPPAEKQAQCDGYDMHRLKGPQKKGNPAANDDALVFEFVVNSSRLCKFLPNWNVYRAEFLRHRRGRVGLKSSLWKCRSAEPATSQKMVEDNMRVTSASMLGINCITYSDLAYSH
ncbi:hypothetical protein T07_1147 [Trichinella nelsoni]|uniref:Uncharacterized protein n=1 Tax=Trichinella nelsoni TaxID=6336 RepID=A0A0V0SBC7_9BILA|nr:hypothetical protein T07_1147 [Trichinella nelsoni]